MLVDWVAVGSLATAFAVVVAFVELITSSRERSRDDREAQARKISAWIDSVVYDEPTTATALNASDSPVYRFVAFLVLAQGAGPQTGEDVATRDDDLAHPAALLVLPPGRHPIKLSPWYGGDMGRRAGVEIAFTDASGRHWIRRVTGRLEQTDTDAVEHYRLPMPGTW